MRAGWPGAFGLLCAAVLPPVVLRVWALAERTSGPGLADLRGALADLGVAAIAFAALVVLARIGRPLAAGFAVLWASLHVANFETVRALDAPAWFGDAWFLLDPGFLSGGLQGLASPIAEVGLVLLAGAAAWLGASAGAATRAAGVTLALGIGASLVALVWPESPDLALWRQTDVVLHNASSIARGELLRPRRSAQRIGVDALVEVEPRLLAVLDGEPLAPLGLVQNVLLIVVESLSGAHLPSLAADHGREAPSLMPRLDAYARDHLRYSSYLTHQRRSDQGLYALLCGEPPKLLHGRSKLSEYPARGGRRCLPARLEDEGFHTVYLQAAPLPFMAFDRFMERIGFDEVLGFEDFAHAYKRTSWGVDDLAFYERALEHVERLEQRGQPWLLVLLNGGTHHPYVLPDEFRSDDPSPFGRTLGYLDLALGDFLDALQARDIADDTLIVITSDESAGDLRPQGDRITSELDQNWGALIIGAPEAKPLGVTEPFAQSDLLLSILDYLGAAGRQRGLIGRSVLRARPPARPIPFANQNLALLGMLEAPDGPLVICHDGLGCTDYALDGGLFSGRRTPLASRPETEAVLTAVARAATLGQSELDPLLEVELAAPASFTLEDARGLVLMGGQKFDVGEGEWIEVEFDLELASAPTTRLVEIRHSLRDSRWRARYRENFQLSSGERVRVRYSYAPGKRAEGLDAHTVVRRLSREPATVRVHGARLRLHREGDAPAPGIKRLRFDRRFGS